jgi:hypothetical protein
MLILLGLRNVVSILISADFLKMRNLAKECIEFFTKHLDDILQLPVDLSSFNSNILKNIAKKIPVRSTCDLIVLILGRRN